MLIPRHSGYTPDGRRLYFKGGDDPGADARAQEAERQGRITAATEQINRIFNGEKQVTKSRTIAGTPATTGTRIVPPISYENGDNTMESFGVAATPDRTETYQEWEPSNTSLVNGKFVSDREKLYGDQRSAVYDLNSQEVNRQAQDAERANRFGLARSGLAGGSVDVDSVADINRRTNEGLLRAGGIADQSAADLRAADEGTRSNLISMAQSGIDTGSASTMALNGLKVNADSVASQRSGASVGSLFNDMSQAYLLNQQSKGTAAGSQLPGQQWYGVSSPTQKYTGK